jgi:hypothetical protein
LVVPIISLIELPLLDLSCPEPPPAGVICSKLNLLPLEPDPPEEGKFWFILEGISLSFSGELAGLLANVETESEPVGDDTGLPPFLSARR